MVRGAGTNHSGSALDSCGGRPATRQFRCLAAWGSRLITLGLHDPFLVSSPSPLTNSEKKSDIGAADVFAAEGHSGAWAHHSPFACERNWFAAALGLGSHANGNWFAPAHRACMARFKRRQVAARGDDVWEQNHRHPLGAPADRARPQGATHV